MSESKLPSDRYWCTLPNVDLGPAVDERFRKYHDELDARGRFTQYRLARRRYYGGDHSGSASSMDIAHGGEQGESSEITVNHYGSIITSLHAMATQNRPAFQCAARDDSADSMASVQLTDQILEYELSRGAEAEMVDATRRMLIYQEAGLGVFWHPESGDVVAMEPAPVDPMAADMGEAPPPPREVRAGELRTECFSPFDVARDLSARSASDLTWQIVRRRVNKWDLAAIYPEHEGEILGAPSADRVDLDRATGSRPGMSKAGASDTIYVLELYALRTPACPAGRYARVVGTTTLEAGDLQYKRLPVGLHAPERTIDEATGSARTIDLLGPQQAYDAVLSNLLSNNDAFGRNNMLSAKDHGLDVEDFAGGLQSVKYDPVANAPPPGPMIMPRLSPEDMRLAETIQSDMQKLNAISDIARGAANESIKSGSHGALVAAQAESHNSGNERATAEMRRDWGNRVVETYRAFATSERVIEVTGSDEVRTAESFVGADLEAVLSVDVQIANPYLRTIAGKKELADFYADPARWAENALTIDQHMTFMGTGRIQPLFRSARAKAIAVREENEAIAKGEPVAALRTDNHEVHIREHTALLDGRQRQKLAPEVIAKLDEHIRAHDALWVTLTIQEPHILAATGQRPAPLPMMAAPAPGGPPGMGGPPQPGNDNGKPPAANDNASPVDAPVNPNPAPMANGPAMPQQPVNPQSGKRAPAAGGMQ
jgi:hypothetical protein